MRQIRRDDGVSAVIGFTIAIVLFTVSFYYIVEQSVQREGDTTVAETANFDSRAQSLAGILLEPGRSWYENDDACLTVAPWRNEDAWDPDGVGTTGRFGLGDERCEYEPSDARNRNNLSFWKFRNINAAKLSAQANDKVDYDEARSSLDLDDSNMDFHLRSWPVLASVQQVLGSNRQDPNMRPMYIGTFAQASAAQTKDITPTLADNGDHVKLTATITNDKPATTQFYLWVEVNWKTPREVYLSTPLLTQTSSATIELFVYKSSDWTWRKASGDLCGGPGQCDHPFISWKLYDNLRELDSGRFNLGSVVDPNAPTEPALDIDMSDVPNPVTNLFVHSEDPSWDVTSGATDARVDYRAYAGDGARKSMTAGAWDLLVTHPDATTNTYALGATNGGVYEIPIAAAPDGVGSHQVEIRQGGVTKNWDRVVAVDEEVHEYDWQPSGYQPSTAATAETKYIDYLVQKFDRKVYDNEYASFEIPYDATLDDGYPKGDVLPADQNELKFWLPDLLGDYTANPPTCNLDRYTTIIVGSDVDQVVLTPASVKWTLDCWVEAGGTLIVFGTAESHNNWLQPVYFTTIEDGAGNGLAAPDPDHPILNVPNQLDYDSYVSGSEWDSGTPDFTPVVQTDTGDILTISDPGSQGAGSVILTGWRPNALTPNQAANCEPMTVRCEGLMLLHNLITITYRDLYLDYGPPLPTQAANGVQTRVVSVYHPELEQLVTVQLQIFVFEGS